MDESLHQISGDYYMDVREFKSGSIEVVVKVINSMHVGAIWSVADPNSYSNYCKSIGESSSTKDRLLPHSSAEKSDSQKSGDHCRAVRRASKNIRLLVKAIEADRLLTLTYRKNQENREEVKSHFRRFLELIRKGWKGCEGQRDWQYVAVLERQERGAYHIHCAVKGWQRISFLRSAWFKTLGGRGNETGEGTPGNIDVTSPQKARWGTQKREWKSGKLAGYLTKYLSKTFDEETSEKRRYWHSKDAVVPVKQRFMLCATTMADAINEIASIIYLHYGLAIDFARSWMSFGGDCLWLSLGETT
jgi:hypothetical protein